MGRLNGLPGSSLPPFRDGLGVLSKTLLGVLLGSSSVRDGRLLFRCDLLPDLVYLCGHDVEHILQRLAADPR